MKSVRVMLSWLCLAGAGVAHAQGGASAAPGATSGAAARTAVAAALQPSQTLSHGLFTDVRVYRPAGAVRQFVLLLVGGDAAGMADQRLLRHAVDSGAMVAVVPLAPFYQRLMAQSSRCAYAAGAFENLAREVQALEHLSTYRSPMLVGAGDAAAFAYALVAQAPNGTFASAVSAGYCPRLTLAMPLCAVNALRWRGPAADGSVDLLPASALPVPWAALPAQTPAGSACTVAEARDFVRQVPGATWAAPASEAAGAHASAFAAAYDALAGRSVALAEPPAQLADLPVVEVPSAAPGRRFVVLLSGDGGWADIDKRLAAAFVDQGLPVAGLDSLRYFWSKRTPEGLAGDVDRIVRYYAARWKRDEVILVGYSQGADVLPFAINRLPAATRSHVALTALLGPGQKASFEFHLSNWIGPSGDQPIAPEAQKLAADGTLCVYGETERDSLCPSLAPQHARLLALSGGHHFGGDYEVLAAKILAAAPR